MPQPVHTVQHILSENINVLVSRFRRLPVAYIDGRW